MIITSCQSSSDTVEWKDPFLKKLGSFGLRFLAAFEVLV